MQVARLNSLPLLEPRATRFQFALLRAGRPAVRPEITSAIDANVRELRSSRQRIGGDGKMPLVVCWVSSSAFICEIRGRPCLSSANAAPGPRTVAECGGGPAAPTGRMIAALRIDPHEKPSPFDSDGQATNK